ncbi:hypothetical protein CP533_5360, partial [Ophiocordyceps camponoti-saundersi (nom. inval.)]
LATLFSHTWDTDLPRHASGVQAALDRNLLSDSPVPSMASGVDALATEAPPLGSPSPNNQSDSVLSNSITRPSKRLREAESASPHDRAKSDQLNSLESPTKSARLAVATNSKSPPQPPLPGSSAFQNDRQRQSAETIVDPSSPPPHYGVIESLMSAATKAMNHHTDAPQVAPTANMDPTVKAITTLSTPISSAPRVDGHVESSPHSTTSLPGAPGTESPTVMDVDGEREGPGSTQVYREDHRPQPGSLSYPGSLQTPGPPPETSTRGMSFPGPNQVHSSPPASGGKKHKCPYCSTEFTRHHNLKSHLLTHSQEKPYVCTECQMRFRRLHDLKRHGKLHTGEKPHVCPKCDRKFARGDALARHGKGAGACAGRRASMGSFADGETLDSAVGGGDESALPSATYENGDDEELRRQSLPSVSSQHASSGHIDAFGAHSRTYPPPGPRPAASGLYPPTVNRVQASASNTGSSSLPSSMANASSSSASPIHDNSGMYSQTGMTESPKPLSPGLQAHDSPGPARLRSSSPQRQFSQQQVCRRPTELHSPQSVQSRPKLPGLTYAGFAATGSLGHNHGRLPSGVQLGGDNENLFAHSDPNVWAYIQTLEDKVKALTDMFTSLDQEMKELRNEIRKGAVNG